MERGVSVLTNMDEFHAGKHNPGGSDGEQSGDLVQSLGRENPLEKGIATHSSILAWRIPWTEEPGGLQSMGSQRVRHKLVTNRHSDSTDSA